MTKTDVLIIGAGTAGLSALREVRKKTDRYLLVNDGPFGTTCARVGCMPSKVLIEAANAFHQRHRFEAFGIRHADRLAVDLPAVMTRVRRLRDFYVSSTLKLTDELGERVIQGKARLLGPQRVEINGEEFDCKRIIIATGSRPVIPSDWQGMGDQILTTDSLFEQTDFRPRIAVIGMGPVGIEIAQAMSRLGLTVSGFGSDKQLAGLSDERVNEQLLSRLQQEFAIHLGYQASLSEVDNSIAVSAGSRREIVDQVVVAVGRRPNIDGLGLEQLGVPLDDNGLPAVNSQTLQIADLPVFLAGDANGDRMVLHEVADDGRIAGHNAVADKVSDYCRRTPMNIVFCDPEVAVVGQALKDLDPDAVITGQADFSDQGRARAAQRNYGLMRVYAEKTTGRLLGAEMAVPAAEHMAHTLALAIDRQLTLEELLMMPIYHPVLEEGMRTALRDALSKCQSDAHFALSRCESLHTEALD